MERVYNQKTASPDQIIGYFDHEIFTPDEAAHFTAIKLRVLQEGIELREQLWLNRPSGRIFLDICWEPIHDEAGQVIGVASATVDLTTIKLAQEELERTENMLAEGQRIAHLGSFEYIAATGTTVWSEEEYRIYGLDPAEPSPAYEVMLARCIHPDDAALLHETFTKALQDHSIYELEHRIVRHDGSIRVVHDKAYPYFDETGNLVRYIGTTLDITERKRAEEELCRQQMEIEDLYHNAPVGLCLLDTELRFIRINERLAEINGFPAADHIGKRVRDLIPRIADAVEPVMRHIMETGEPKFDIEIVSETPAQPGVARSWLEQWLPVKDDQGRVIGLSIVVEETTERKQAEEALIAAHRRLVLAQQSAGAGIWDWDLKTGAFVWSPELFHLFGLDPTEQPTYELWENILHPQDSEQAKKCVEQAIQNRTSLDSEYRIFLPNGQVRWINALGSAVYDENGKPQTMSGICIDITERKEIERALWDSQKRFSSVFQTSPAGIFVTRLSDGLFIEANEAYLQIIGYSAQEIRERTSKELNIWVNLEDRKKIINLLHQQGRVDNSETKFRRKNGEIADILFSAVLFEQAGESCILGVLMDITERRKAEEALRESREDLNRAQAVAHVGSWRMNVQRNELTWSDENHHIFGVSEGTPMTYETFLGTIHPDDRDFVNKKWEAALSGEKYDVEHRIVVDGKIKWVRERAELEFNKTGILLGGFGTTQDITARKEAEEALRKSRDELEMRVRERTKELAQTVDVLESEVRERVLAEKVARTERKRFEDVLEMMPAYAILLTPDYRVAYANRTFRDWFGDDHGKRCYEFLFNRTEPCEDCQTYTVLKTQKSHFWEWTGPNGHNYDIYDYPFTDTDGSPLIMEIGVDVTAHKKAQEAVRQGEERYRSLTVATTQVIWTTDAQGQVVGDMPSWRAFTGQSVEEIQGWGWINSLHPDDRDRTAKIWAQSVQNKSLYQTEYRIRRHNGDYRDMSVRGVPVLEQDGSIREWIGTCTDITERKLAEEALRSASLYARGLLEASLDPLVTISPEGKITDVNKATELATGVNRELLIGSDFSNYFTEPEKAREGYKQVFARGFVTDYPLTIRHVSGGTMNVLYNATVYKDTYGNVLGVFAAARDVTERKAIQKKQSVTNSLLKLFARKTLRKTYLDSTVKIIRNWSGCEFVGVRIKDEGKNIPYESCVGFDADFLAKENNLHLGRDNCVCIRAILENPQKQEMNFMTAGGSFYCNDSQAFLNNLTDPQKKEYRGNCIKHGFQSISVVPIRYRDEILGAIHIADFKKDMVLLSKIQFIETTIVPLIGEAVHRFNAESELEKHRLHLEDMVRQRTDDLARSNKDLEQFAYVASHDLQEPLRAVSGFVELLKRNLQNSLDAKTTEYMNFTVEGAKRMQLLINGLLEYSRISARGNKPEQTDSKAALDLAIAHLLTSIKESDAKIIAEPLPTIRIDSMQLTQLFQNLIGNAIKFRSEKRPPEIHISAVRQANAWQFAITDNGIGIEPQYAERIFLIFQRLHTRQKYSGTGIGLALCKKIIERHGGKIWVESKGQGSTFYFTVPDIGEN